MKERDKSGNKGINKSFDLFALFKGTTVFKLMFVTNIFMLMVERLIPYVVLKHLKTTK